MQLTQQYSLLNQLRHFGLNPREWNLKLLKKSNKRLSKQKVYLTHNEIPDLKMMGHCTKQSERHLWVDLYLM